METFILNKEVITLSQFLKTNGYINSGGEAKFFLLENNCYINGEHIILRGKKIYSNDIVKINEDEYKIK